MNDYADEAVIASRLTNDPPAMGSDYSTHSRGWERYPGLRRPKVHVSAEARRAQLLADLDLEAAAAELINRTAPRRGEPREWDHDA